MERGSSSKFKRLCVFCGSHPGHREVFSVAATELGDEMFDWFAFIIFIVILFVADFLILDACLFLVAHHLLIKRLRI